MSFIQQDSGYEYVPDFWGKQTEGWWNCLATKDLNQDGKLDFIFGNEGTNTQYKVNDKTPMLLDFADYDDNNFIDPIMSYYLNGVAYPSHTRDELLSQLSSLKSIFTSYEQYANTTTEKLLTYLPKESTNRWKVHKMESCLYLSSEKGYEKKTLPFEAQQSPIRSIFIDDINQDGHDDLLLCGNRNKMALKYGKYDANRGLVLLGDGKGNFHPLSEIESGLNLIGDVADIEKIDDTYFFSIVNDSLTCYSLNFDK